MQVFTPSRPSFELPSSVSRRFLLAADGASSSIRKQLNAAYTGTTASSQWFIVDAVAASPDAEAALLERWPDFNFCCGCDTVFVHARTPSSPAHHRWEFLLQSDGGAPSSAALLRSVGVPASLVRIIREVRPDDDRCRALLCMMRSAGAVHVPQSHRV
jgi:hypothetical protein